MPGPREIAELIWEIFSQNPMWGRHRTAMTMWAHAGSLHLRHYGPGHPAAPQAYSTRTRVMRWGVWPTWVLVAIDHYSRAVTAVAPLEGPNAGWVVEVLESAFLRHGPPKHLISDQDGIFTGEAFAKLVQDWNIKHRFGAVGKHGSIAVTEQLIWTLKHEWLARVVLIRGLDHLGQPLVDFDEYYNEHRCHQRLDGATPATVYRGQTWRKPDRSAKQVTGPIRMRHFPEQRITVYELAA